MPIKGFTCRLGVIFAELKLKDKSFTQAKFAKRVGISTTALSALVKEKSLPSYEVAYEIAQELNRKMEDIWAKE